MFKNVNYFTPAPSSLGNKVIQNYDLSSDPNGNLEILINNQGQNTLALRYIADITDVTKFDTIFVQALACHLAVNVAYQITKSEKVVEMANEMLKQELPALVALSGQENPPTRIENSKFVQARIRGTVGNDAVAGMYTTFGSQWD